MLRRTFLVAITSVSGLSACRQNGSGSDRLPLPADLGQRLESVKSVVHFQPEGYYMGYLPEENRGNADSLLRGLVDKLQQNLPRTPSRHYLRRELNDTYDWFQLSDTEDRERCAANLTKILLAIGLFGDDKDINRWLDSVGPIAALSHPQLEN